MEDVVRAGDAEHKAYGADHYSDLDGDWPAANTPDEDIRMELIDLRDNEMREESEKKKNEETNQEKNKEKKKNGKN